MTCRKPKRKSIQMNLKFLIAWSGRYADARMMWYVDKKMMGGFWGGEVAGFHVQDYCSGDQKSVLGIILYFLASKKLSVVKRGRKRKPAERCFLGLFTTPTAREGGNDCAEIKNENSKKFKTRNK